MNEKSKEELLGAIARGWCHKKNSSKVMDSDLAVAISEEVVKFIEDLLATKESKPTTDRGGKSVKSYLTTKEGKASSDSREPTTAKVRPKKIEKITTNWWLTSGSDILDKVNELVDAVNSLSKNETK